MLMKLIAATLAGTVLMSSAGAAWSQEDTRYIFRYRAGLVQAASDDGNTPDNGEEEPGPTGPPDYTEIELGNGWKFYCPSAPATADFTLAHLVGKPIAVQVDADTIYTLPDGSGPLGVFIYYDARYLPDTYGFEAYLDPASFGCRDEWGGIAILPGWTKPDRDSAVAGGGFESAIVNARVVGGMSFVIRPPH